MNEEDFYNLRVGQVIWYKGNGYEIKGLAKENYDSTELEATIHFYCGYSYRWDKICADCSLEAPKEKKRYYAHIIQYNPFSRQDRTDLGIIFLDDDGKTLSGIEPSKDDCKGLKKIESIFWEE